MSDHFTEDDNNDDDEFIDDDQSSRFSYHVARERVTKLRDNLINMLPHYFNRHTGECYLKLYLIFYLKICFMFRVWVVVSVQEPT